MKPSRVNPAVGHIVHYHPIELDDRGPAYAAVVVDIWADGERVDLYVFPTSVSEGKVIEGVRESDTEGDAWSRPQ